MKLAPFLVANFAYNPFLFVFTLLEIPTVTNGDFSMAGMIEKMGIIGVLAYLTHQQRTDNKESNKNWREEEAIIRKQWAEKEDRIIARYENLLTEQSKDYKQNLQEKEKIIQDLHKIILEKREK
jgi:hypothetical protein